VAFENSTHLLLVAKLETRLLSEAQRLFKSFLARNEGVAFSERVIFAG
jgi:hypothetical protein